MLLLLLLLLVVVLVFCVFPVLPADPHWANELLCIHAAAAAESCMFFPQTPPCCPACWPGSPGQWTPLRLTG
jgi:hypothetical protein